MYSDETLSDLRDYEPGDAGTETVDHLAMLGLVAVRVASDRRSVTDSWLTDLGREVLAAISSEAP